PTRPQAGIRAFSWAISASAAGGTPPWQGTHFSPVRPLIRALLLPLLARVALQPALPEVFLFAEVPAHPAREHEEDVAQPVHVAERRLADRLHARQGDDLPLGAAAPRAALMEKAADA